LISLSNKLRSLLFKGGTGAGQFMHHNLYDRPFYYKQNIDLYTVIIVNVILF